MANITYKAKKIISWLLAGDFKTIYSMMMRYNPFAYYRLDNAGYQKWWNKHKDDAPDISALAYRPLISVLLIATEKESGSITSIIKQTYDNWQLCIAITKETHLDDPRINFITVQKKASQGEVLNKLLAESKGEHLIILKDSHELNPSALSFYASALNERKDYKLVYSDEDRIDQHGHHIDPFFKPKFSPALLYSLDYISRGGLFNAAAVKAVGGFDASLKSGHVYDLALKLIQHTHDAEICHIPYIMHHCLVQNTSNTEQLETHANEAKISSHIVERYLGTKVSVINTDGDRIFHKVHPGKIKNHPKISIIIPTKDKVDLLKACIVSLINKTSYPNYEIIVVDNQSADQDALSYLDSLKGIGIMTLRYNKPYNYSAINNYAARFAKGEVLCFLNNDIEIINSDWLEEMMLWLLKPDVGIVGAKLYFPITGNIQHAGMHCVTNPYTGDNYITHRYIHQPGSSKGYLNSLCLAHEVSSITGACMLMKKNMFIKVGKFDAKNTPTSYSDVDLCFRVRDEGYKVIWTPYAEAYHHESASRGLDIERGKAGYDYMIRRWLKYMKNDVSVNPNISLYYNKCEVLAHGIKP